MYCPAYLQQAFTYLQINLVSTDLQLFLVRFKHFFDVIGNLRN